MYYSIVFFIFGIIYLTLFFSYLKEKELSSVRKIKKIRALIFAIIGIVAAIYTYF